MSISLNDHLKSAAFDFLADQALLPPLAGIVAQYAPECFPLKKGIPKGDDDASIEAIIRLIEPEVQAAYDSADRSLRMKTALTTLACLTQKQYEKIIEHPYPPLRLLGGSFGSKVGRIYSELFSDLTDWDLGHPVLAPIRETFQLLINYCQNHDKEAEGAANVMHLLRKFYQSEEHAAYFKSSKRPLYTTHIFDRLFWPYDYDMWFPDLLTDFVRNGTVTIPEDMLARCNHRIT